MYIWKRTLPLLRERLWIGAGPGTFATEFPQNDFAGKRRVGHGFHAIHDKPHNGYLQIAHGSGVLALLCFLVLVSVFFAKSIRLLRRCTMASARYSIEFLPGITASILAYLIAAMANDSVVSVAPVFWLLLGAGFAVLERSRLIVETPDS